MELVVIDGQGGSDDLTIETPAGQEQIDFHPGATADAASLTFRGYGANTLLPVRYENIGTGGSLTLDDAGAVRTDDLTVNGRDLANASEEFSVGVLGLAADQLAINDGTSGTFQLTVSITAAGVDELRLNGLAGDDLFRVAGDHPFTGGILIDGGSPSASDVVNFTGGGADVDVNLAAPSITESGFAPVSLTGVEVANVNAATGDVDVAGTSGDDDVTFSPTASDAGQITLAGLNTVFNLDNVGDLDVDALGGDDTLNVNGTTAGETIDVDGSAVQVGSLLEVDYTGFEALAVFGHEGDDTFNVTADPNIPIFIDGGDPIGVTAGDKFGIIAGGGGVAFEPGPENDEGGIRVGSNARISFDHIEEGEVTGASCALVMGTDGDDDITIIARNELANPAQFLGTDGVQDFTSSVNAGLQLLWIDTPELYIDALAGDDDIVLRTRAPNLADWNMEVYIVGGAPSAATGDQGDVIEIETPYQANDDVVYTPTGSETGDVLLDENDNGVNDGTDTLIQIVSEFVIDCNGDEENEYRSSTGGVEQLILEGEAGDDMLTVAGPADTANIYVHTPGAMIDAGTVAVNTWLPIDYQNLGSSGTVTVDDSASGAVDGTLVYQGTALDDRFRVCPVLG